MVEDSGRNIGDFEYTRRFFCRALPTQLDDNDSPTLIIQSYYVHQDNYALRVRLKTKSVRIAMTPDLDPLAVLEKYRDEFRLGAVTVKGPSVGGTRYEASRDLDSRIAGELIKRGGHVTIKHRRVRRHQRSPDHCGSGTYRAGHQSGDPEILHHRNHRPIAVQQ